MLTTCWLEWALITRRVAFKHIYARYTYHIYWFRLIRIQPTDPLRLRSSYFSPLYFLIVSYEYLLRHSH